MIIKIAPFLPLKKAKTLSGYQKTNLEPTQKPVKQEEHKLENPNFGGSLWF